ncbi:hypothetical protein B0T17DRAFT_396878 [Bombardia bombarda]|uniref:Uncharacterized protein n=1 Tax=Bombardia bombarda TaxID=252184 RepID=A0AA39TMU9_9PEZI|nr:hypothetical protein B0T17DRAFT_396878 [Bombardia bombarda]
MAARRKTKPSAKSKDSRANGTLTPPSSCTRHPKQKSSQRVQMSENPRGRSLDISMLLNAPSSVGLPQKPSNGCEEQVGTRQRKRGRDSEEEQQLCSEAARPPKRAKKSTSDVSDKSQPLNAKALETHTVREGYVDLLELAGLESDNIHGNGGSKRSASKVRIEDGSTISTGTGDHYTATLF